MSGPVSRPQKVVIVHDWLLKGGAELVVEQLHAMYPDAPIYTSYCTPEWRERLDGKVVTGWLQYLGRIRKFIPFLRIWWFTHLNLDNYDLVISSSGAEAKGIIVNRQERMWLSNLRAALGAGEHRKGAVQDGTASAERSQQQRDVRESRRPHTLHVNYCHAPTHYYWSRYEEYMAHPGFGIFDSLARLGLKLLVTPLRRWDLKASKRPDLMVANSTHIQQQIKQYYGRDAEVVFPPVNTERFQKATDDIQHAGFLISGRQTPYKRFDLAVQACSKLGVPLNVIGAGPDNSRLKKLASPSVTFLGPVDDPEQERAFASAQALIFPGLDDFGITPVEAMAAGTPVVAYRGGGALDYVVPGKTGEFFTEQSVASLSEAIQNFDPNDYKKSDLHDMAAKFNPETFRTHMQSVIDKAWASFRPE